MRQHLLLRGSRDFDSEADYERFLHQVLERGNRGRQENLALELAAMKPLPQTRLSEYDEVNCTVGSASTIRVKKLGLLGAGAADWPGTQGGSLRGRT